MLTHWKSTSQHLYSYKINPPTPPHLPHLMDGQRLRRTGKSIWLNEERHVWENMAVRPSPSESTAAKTLLGILALKFFQAFFFFVLYWKTQWAKLSRVFFSSVVSMSWTVSFESLLWVDEPIEEAMGKRDSADPSFLWAPLCRSSSSCWNATESEPLRHPGGAAPWICAAGFFLISILTFRKNS